MNEKARLEYANFKNNLVDVVKIERSRYSESKSDLIKKILDEAKVFRGQEF